MTEENDNPKQPQPTGDRIPDQQEEQELKEESVQPISKSQPLPNASVEPIPLQKPETEKMEVHHHGHVHEKKKWLEYLFQFFMLFLAVFCGFLAEYQLEHRIENERGQQYIYLFYKDLKTDTAEFSRIIAINEQKTRALGDIFNCYDTVRKNWKATSCLVPIVKNSRSNSTITFSFSALHQLKNAGGYRLLDKEDKDSIMVYDNAIQAYKSFEATNFQQSQDNVRNTFSELGDFMSNKFINPGSSSADSTQVEMPLLFSDDKVLLNKYFNDIFRYRNTIAAQERNLKRFKERAQRLIKYFENKYSLK